MAWNALRSWMNRPTRPRPGTPRPRRTARFNLEVLEARLTPSIFTVGANMNITKSGVDDAETSIVINPSNPLNLFATSTAGNAFIYSRDGGQTWKNSDISQVLGGVSGGDQQAAWDNLGNLFVTYFGGQNFDSVIALSTDGGATFQLLLDTGVFGDQPNIATGNGEVWMDYTNANGGRSATGAQVFGLGSVGPFSAPQAYPGNTGTFGDLAIGPQGQVLAVYQENNGLGPSQTYASLNPTGVNGTFGAQINLGTVNVGSFQPITPQPNRTIDSELNLAWDRSGGPHNGRVYLVNCDSATVGSSDTDIFVRYSDDNGKTWSSAVRVNDDAKGNGVSQFMPAIAVSDTTGYVGVGWYDCRNDPVNDTKVEAWCAISTDGGKTFSPNMKLSQGQSFAPPTGFDFGDYNKASYVGGTFLYSWSDNSNSTLDNPGGAFGPTDIYLAPVTLTPPPVIPPPIIPPPAPVEPTPAGPIVVVGADKNGGPQVKVYNTDGTLKFSFFAYDASFKGGVRVAAGDVNGDGVMDIITAPGAGGSPEIKVFDGRDLHLLQDFDAFSPTFNFGLYVAAADINGDFKADIIVGPGKSGGDTVKVFDGATAADIMEVHPYGGTWNGGITVAAGDMNGDGVNDIVTGTAAGASEVREFSGVDGSLLNVFQAGGKTGIFVSAGDLNNDGTGNILVSDVKGLPTVSTYDATGFFVGSFSAFQNFSAVNSLIASAAFHKPIPVPWVAGSRVAIVKQSDGKTFGFAVGSGAGKSSEMRYFTTDSSLSGNFDVRPFGSSSLIGVYVG
jgi:hypothetical protein